MTIPASALARAALGFSVAAVILLAIKTDLALSKP
jgi:hypothetical protein